MSPLPTDAELNLPVGARRAEVLEGIEGQGLAVLRLYASVANPLRSSTWCWRAKGESTEGIGGQSDVVLRLHVLVHDSHEELDLPLGEREVRVPEGIEGQPLPSSTRC